MINFIVVDDLNFWQDMVEERITKVLFDSDVNYQIYKFRDYDETFFDLSLKCIENKVYILDIETETSNGLEVARKIRQFDEVSEIIFLTAYYVNEMYVNEFLTLSLKSMGFIDKEQIGLLDFKLEEIVKKFFLNKILKINTISSCKLVRFRDILYIEAKDRNTLIHTLNSVIRTSKSLKEVENSLKKQGDFFVKTHRACVVNLNHVINFDFKNKKITFFNNEWCHLLAKSYKNKIKAQIDRHFD